MRGKNKEIWTVFFQHFYSESKVNYVSVAHLVVRSMNHFGVTWLIIISSSYAIKAEINFGIVVTCMSIQTPLNCIVGIIYWKEKLNWKMALGTVILLVGVTWVSFAKGHNDY